MTMYTIYYSTISFNIYVYLSVKFQTFKCTFEGQKKLKSLFWSHSGYTSLNLVRDLLFQSAKFFCDPLCLF